MSKCTYCGAEDGPYHTCAKYMHDVRIPELEADIQAKDAQIAALVTACSQLYAAFYDEPRDGFFTEHQVHALARAKTMIKEVGND